MHSKALILVGGPSRGTRFRPLSLDQPKPLFDVAGHPIIWHCLKALTKEPSIKEVLLIGYYEEHVFTSFINDWRNEFAQFSSIKYMREYQALGTAGGLYHFRDAILRGGPSQFFVLNADVCCSFPFSEMLALMQEKSAEAVILGTKVPNEVAKHFGCIVSDPETHVVRHYVEKPESHLSSLINCGAYLFSSSIFQSIRAAMQAKAERIASEGYYHNTSADGDSSEVLRLEQDILGPLSDTGRFYVYETKGFWRQIKTASSAVPANALYLQQAWQSNPQTPGLAAPSAGIIAPVFIHPTAHVDPTAKLGPNVSIGPRAVIGAGVRVKDSIVLEDAEIKHDACVLWSIIGWNSKVGAWARVEGSPVAPGTHGTTIVKNGIKVQTISILAKDCTVHDEVRVQNCVCLPFKELKRDVMNEIIM